MLSVSHHISVESRLHRAVKHKDSIGLDYGVVLYLMCLLDSGALHISYVSKKFLVYHYIYLHTFIRPHKSRVTLADKKTLIYIKEILLIFPTTWSVSSCVHGINVDFTMVYSLGKEATTGIFVVNWTHWFSAPSIHRSSEACSLWVFTTPIPVSIGDPFAPKAFTPVLNFVEIIRPW